jgi:hypothetical protein
VRRVLLGGMFVGVMFHGFFGVPGGMHRVAMSNVRMVTGLDGVAFIVMTSGFAMVLGRVIVMLGGFEMVFNAFVLRHVVLSSLPIVRGVEYGAMKG